MREEGGGRLLRAEDPAVPWVIYTGYPSPHEVTTAEGKTREHDLGGAPQIPRVPHLSHCPAAPTSPPAGCRVQTRRRHAQPRGACNVPPSAGLSLREQWPRRGAQRQAPGGPGGQPRPAEHLPTPTTESRGSGSVRREGEQRNRTCGGGLGSGSPLRRTPRD